MGEYNYLLMLGVYAILLYAVGSYFGKKAKRTKAPEKIVVFDNHGRRTFARPKEERGGGRRDKTRPI